MVIMVVFVVVWVKMFLFFVFNIEVSCVLWVM